MCYNSEETCNLNINCNIGWEYFHGPERKMVVDALGENIEGIDTNQKRTDQKNPLH